MFYKPFRRNLFASLATAVLLTGCGGKDFSESTLPPQQVATVSSQTLGLSKVDGVQNIASLQTFTDRITGTPHNVLYVPAGRHEIEVNYLSAVRTITLQPVHVSVMAAHSYSLELVDGQVQFSETTFGITRNIPLYKRLLTTDGASVPRQTVIININRVPTAPIKSQQAETPNHTYTSPMPAGPTTYAQWSAQHPDAVGSEEKNNN